MPAYTVEHFFCLRAVEKTSLQCNGPMQCILRLGPHNKGALRFCDLEEPSEQERSRDRWGTAVHAQAAL